jgi:hypothetical protein
MVLDDLNMSTPEGRLALREALVEGVLKGDVSRETAAVALRAIADQGREDQEQSAKASPAQSLIVEVARFGDASNGTPEVEAP